MKHLELFLAAITSHKRVIISYLSKIYTKK